MSVVCLCEERGQLLLPKWNYGRLQHLFRLAVDIITVKPAFEFSLRSNGFEHETN
jgi:hypothetical protein